MSRDALCMGMRRTALWKALDGGDARKGAGSEQAAQDPVL